MKRDELKGAPLMLATGQGLPPDPNEPPVGELEAWCAYHGIEYVKGSGAPPAPGEARPE
jgi:hypothetical protein